MEEIKIAEPSYYAIIPANVRYDKDLTPNAKLLYGEITALCNSKGYCWANNEYFANLYDVSKTSISKWISSLIEKKYVESKLLYKEGTKEILNRYLTLVVNPIEEKLNTPMQVSLNSPIEEKLKDNTTISNITIINTTVNNNIDFDVLLAYINKKFDRSFKLINDSVRRKFKARIKDGYTKEDIKNCIDNLANVEYHKNNGFQYCTPEFISRSETLEKYSAKLGLDIKHKEVQTQIPLGGR